MLGKTDEGRFENLHLSSFVGDTSPVKQWAGIFLLFLLVVSITDWPFLVVFWHLWPMSVWAEIFSFSNCRSANPGSALGVLSGCFSISATLSFTFEQTQKLTASQGHCSLLLLPFPLKGMNVFVLPGEHSRTTSAHTSSFILQGIFPQNPSQLSSEKAQLCSSKTQTLCLSANLQDPKVQSRIHHWLRNYKAGFPGLGGAIPAAYIKM